MNFKEFSIYDNCEPAGVELPKISVEESVLKSIDGSLDNNSSSFDLLKALSRNALISKGINKISDFLSIDGIL
jgi:hypothetical protein